MVSQAHFDKVSSYLVQAGHENLRVVFGGKTEDGIYVQPTVVDGVSADSLLFKEEIFGPVLTISSAAWAAPWRLLRFSATTLIGGACLDCDQALLLNARALEFFFLSVESLQFRLALL